ncbi:MAG: helix-turn-helix transcriptional regulator [Lentisphaeria bacterium]|nr:helix-turn-helix transcriptional regulator [Lentisphaeria bacterium]
MTEPLAILGIRLKKLRKERKLTLQEVADRTGLTAGLLSKIENYRTVPSLPVLLAIARALEADLSALFEGVSAESRPRWALIRASEQEPVPREESRGLDYRMIAEMPLSPGTLQLMHVTVRSGAEREPVTSEGDEILYLLSGKLRYFLDGEPVDFEAGDTLVFDGALPHYPENPGGADAVLLVCYLLRSAT